MTATQVPVIDISRFDAGDAIERANLARLVDDTFENTGFMTIVGHGVSRDLIDRAAAAAADFFLMPQDKKFQASLADRGRGYVPLGEVSAARGQGDAMALSDVKEAFAIGPMGSADAQNKLARPHFVENVWPAEPAQFAPVMREYYAEMEKLAARLSRIFAVALRLPEDYFERFYSEHNDIFRLQYYPAQDIPPAPGSFRISAHTDNGAFAIVGVGDGEGQDGLQLQDKAGNWIDVPPLEYSFVVNVGDLLKTWTNDRWQSTLHRVVNPPAGAKPSPRFSFPFHAHPNYDAIIEALPTCVDPGASPRHPPTGAGEHRKKKIALSNPKTAESADTV